MSSKPIIIAPSVFACDFSRIGEEITRIQKAGADWFHVDIMDGHFVDNFTMGPAVTEAIHRLIDPGETATLIKVRTARHAALYSLGRLEEADEEYRAIELLFLEALFLCFCWEHGVAGDCCKRLKLQYQMFVCA